MTNSLTHAPEQQPPTLVPKLAGAGLAVAITAGLILGLAPAPTDTGTQRPRPAQLQQVAPDWTHRVAEADEPATASVEPGAADDTITFASALTEAPRFATTTVPIADLSPASIPAAWATPANVDTSAPARPGIAPRPPAIASAPPATAGSPGRGGPNPGRPGLPLTRPDGSGPASAGPGSPTVPATNGPDAPIASTPNAPSTAPPPADLPDVPSGPVVASNDPGDDWFSPGNSPGTAVIDGDYTLDGGTLLFEILGTEAGLQYDQLIVNGNVDLNAGNVVIAFIDGFVPDGADIFELILGDLITVDNSVNFYYGFFDSALNPLWALHAPTNLSMYNLWDMGSGLTMGVSGQNDGSGERFTVQFDSASANNSAPQAGPDQDVQPLAIGAPIPTPAPLLLIAAGMLLTGTWLRQGRGA